MLSPPKYPELGVIDSAGLNDALADADIIINTTSLACMQVMPCHVRWTTPGRCCCQIIDPAETEWMRLQPIAA